MRGWLFACQLMRFGLVGVIGAGVYFLATLLLVRYRGWSVVSGASVSFVLVISINYLLHYSWTFRSRRPHSSATVRFVVASVGGMVINSGFLFLGPRLVEWSPEALLLTGVCLVVLWNYLMARFWVFTDADSA